VTGVGGGRLRVPLRPPAGAGARRLALGLGEDGHVVAPAALAAAVRADAATALGAYSADAGGGSAPPRPGGGPPRPGGPCGWRGTLTCGGAGPPALGQKAYGHLSQTLATSYLS